MKRIRNTLAALVAVGWLFGAGGPAQAVIGIPDDVPGATLLFPFVKIDPTPTPDSRQDTLVVVTNTANTTTVAHFTLWNRESVHVYDFNVVLTAHDVYGCSLIDLIVTGAGCPGGVFPAPPQVATLLRVPGEDLLTGYVTVDAVTTATFLFPGQGGYPFRDINTLIGHMYLVNLVNGSASGFNAVSLEAVSPFPPVLPFIGQPAFAVFFPRQISFYLTRCLEEQTAAACVPGIYDNRERIDGPSGRLAQTLFILDGLATLNSNGLSLLPRYFSATALQGQTEVFLWKDRNAASASQNFVNVAVYDEAENVHSIQFDLRFEVNFARTVQIITPGAPGGWLRIKFSCGQFACSDYAPELGAPGIDGATERSPVQSVAFSVQNAQSSNASLRWDAVFPAHRHYGDYVPSALFE